MHMPMPITRFVLMLAALGASVALTAGSATAGRTAPAPDPRADPLGAPLLVPHIAGDEKWLPGGTANGLNGAPGAFAVDSVGNLYIGGNFNLAGNVPVRGIAKWDGGAWSSIGYGVSDGRVSALAWDGLHNWLYVGGDFASICMNADCSITNPAHNIARWDPAGGGSWHTLLHGLSGEVTALALDDVGNLYVGGRFTSLCIDMDCHYLGGTFNNIAEWNPSGVGTWSALGGGVTGSGSYGPVRALAWWNNGAGVLVVGGDLTMAGAVPVNHLAYWDPTGSGAWFSFLDGVDGSVSALAVDPSTGMIVVGGDFINICGTMPGCGTPTRVNYLAIGIPGRPYWGGIFGGVDWPVMSLAIDNVHHKLFVGGAFNYGYLDSTWTSRVEAHHVIFWDYSAVPATWSALGTGVDGYGGAIAWNGAANLLYMGGDPFTAAGGASTGGIAKWDGAAWSSVGSGDGPGPEVLAVAEDGKGHVYVGGSFRSIGNVFVNNVAMWDSKTRAWSPLGYGVNNAILALLVDPAGNLYASGGFYALCGNPSCTTYGTVVNGIAKWDPVSRSWSGLNWGVGFLPGFIAPVYALALDHNNHLYVGGEFSGFCPDAACATTSPAFNVAVWNIGSSTWSAVGAGIQNSVRALALDQDNNLYAGGVFTYLCGNANCTTDGVRVNHIARWTPGGGWSTVGTGVDSYVLALAVDHNNNLYAGGAFGNICSAPGCTGNTQKVSGIAKWTGGSWSAVGNGVNGFVYALLVDDWNNLFAGGNFATVCGDPECLTAGTVVNNIAKWDAPNGWLALGSGIGPARAAAVEAFGYFHGMLSVGGDFGTAGDKVAANFGRYNYGVYQAAPMVIR